MKFDQYNIIEGIKTAIAKLKYKKPTDIQYRAIPSILNGEDVLAIAQTGTGKTAAFAIPILHLLHIKRLKGRTDGVKCLIWAPTHELAQQISGVFKDLGKHTKVRIACLHGGVSQDPQIEKLDKGVDVVISTPGRMFDLVSQGALDLSGIEILVLDEADHMLNLGFIDDIRDLMKKLPRKRQTLFFSATINDEIKKIAYSIVNNPIRIQISPKDPVAKNITHAVAYVEMDDKRFFLEDLIKTNLEKKLLVFVRTKVRAERVKKAMERAELICETLHSDKTAEEREKCMIAFRSGELKVLVATDISARGIDIPNVDFVINYDLPETAETYVHRVGRTGRGRLKGQAVSFSSTEEKERLATIEEQLGKPILRIEIEKKDYQEILDNSSNPNEDWRALMKQSTDIEEGFKKKKKNKKN